MDTAAPLLDLVAFADEVPTTLPAIEAIEARLGETSAVATARTAIGRGLQEAAARILLAGLLRDERPPAELALSLAPHAEEIWVALRLAASSEGDRVGAILSLCDSERLSSDREAAMLLLATEYLGDDPAPPRLRTRIRLLARRQLLPVTMCLVGHAALATRDDDVLAVAEACVEFAMEPVGGKVASELRNHLESSLRSVLPERPPEEAEAGYTIQRDAPKVGRNEPCPCGSGKKYKRCCGSSSAAPPTEVVPRKHVSPYRPTMTWEQFEDLRSVELVRLVPTEVATQHLVPLMQGLAKYHFFEEAERALDELARRAADERVLDVEGHRHDLFHETLDAGRADLARRLLARLPPEDVEDVQRLALDLVDEHSDLLSRLEALVDEGLRDDRRHKLIDISFTLLQHAPALGLVFARGVIHPENALDSLTLLETMETVRDRLLLSPDEPAWDLYERMEELNQEARLERATVHANEQLAEEVEELRAKANEEARRVRALQARLREQEAALAHAAPEDNEDPGEKRAAPPAGPDIADVDAMRRKITDLKSLLRESTQERRTLRRELATKTDSLAKEPEAAPEIEELEPEHIPEDTPEHRPLLLPELGERFEGSLADLPARIAREAVRNIGALAAGDPAAWRGAKRMRSAPAIRTARLSLAWRMLFTVDQKEMRLRALAVIHRSDLEQALAHYR